VNYSIPKRPFTTKETISRGFQRDPKVMIREPEARPISYDGLVMAKAKCIEVDKAQMSSVRLYWPSTAHCLFKHHDFFLASPHPPASLALGRLARKYNMPTRMWLHGMQHMPGTLAPSTVDVSGAYGDLFVRDRRMP